MGAKPTAATNNNPQNLITMIFADNSSLYTPRCQEFKTAFYGMPGVSTQASEECNADGTFSDFYGSAYVNNLERVAIYDIGGQFMVYINNPGCPVDADGCPVFTKDHPSQQWVFGYYKSFRRALNRAQSIVRGRTYPKPIEIW